MSKIKRLIDDLIDSTIQLIKEDEEFIVKYNRKIIKLQNCKNKEYFTKDVERYKRYIEELKQEIKEYKQDIKELRYHLTK